MYFSFRAQNLSYSPQVPFSFRNRQSLWSILPPPKELSNRDIFLYFRTPKAPDQTIEPRRSLDRSRRPEITGCQIWLDPFLYQGSNRTTKSISLVFSKEVRFSTYHGCDGRYELWCNFVQLDLISNLDLI
jgi:hypothetical protein